MLCEQSFEDFTGRRVYRLRVWIDHELCVYAADLPGCASQGYKNIAECLVNITEAFRGIVASYDDDGEPIPWIRGGACPLFHEERSITVDCGSLLNGKR